MPTSAVYAVRLMGAATALAAVVVGVGVVAAPTPAHAATVTVTTTADVVDAGSCWSVGVSQLPGADGLVSLREAVCAGNNTAGADVISLAAGDYQLTSQLEVSDEVTISGAGIDATTIRAAAAGRAFDAWWGAGLTLNDLTVAGGDVGGAEGGAIVVFDVPLTLDTVRVTGGHASEGGGIWAWGPVTIVNSRLDGNEASGGGGGLFVAGALRMQWTTVADNVAGTNGGGIALQGGSLDTTTIEQSAIVGNEARLSGGGLATTASDDGFTVITDTTFADNGAGASGGALHLAGAASSAALVSSSTITGNTSASTGGLSRSSGFADVNHSIVAENVGGDLGGSWTGAGNLVGVAGGGIVDGASGNVAGSAVSPLDPMLRPLGSFGGATQTRVPLPGSPAVDSATGCGAVDQRTITRPVGSACDRGAVELTAAPETTIASGPTTVSAPDSSIIVANATPSPDAGGGAGAGWVRLECQLDGSGAFTDCPITSTLTGLSVGGHVYAVRAVDSWGATDATPAVHSWTVVTAAATPPSALAATGIENAGLVVSAIMLLCAGGVFVGARRMRARQV